MSEAEPSTSRSCAGCTMCCKLFKIPELGKPAGVWCGHCAVQQGCLIYPERPPTCVDFVCNYLRDPGLSEEWKPSRCKMVLTNELSGRRLLVTVDPQRPDAWKRDPHHAALRSWASQLAPQAGYVLVRIGRRMHAVLADHDTDLGIVAEDDMILAAREMTEQGSRLSVCKVHKDDPRVRAAESTLPR